MKPTFENLGKLQIAQDKGCFNNKLFPEWKHENLNNFLWSVQPLKNLLVTEVNLTYRLRIDIKKCIFMDFFVQVDTTPEWLVGSSAVELCKIFTLVPMLSSSAKVLGFGPLLLCMDTIMPTVKLWSWVNRYVIYFWKSI